MFTGFGSDGIVCAGAGVACGLEAGSANGLAGTAEEGVAAGKANGRAAKMAAKRVVYRAFIMATISLDGGFCKPLGNHRE